jgi:hypothetical protein
MGGAESTGSGGNTNVNLGQPSYPAPQSGFHGSGSVDYPSANAGGSYTGYSGDTYGTVGGHTSTNGGSGVNLGFGFKF